jgi:ABC-type transport system involved in multi-copper enzyme maturation permease subunit
MPIYDQHYRLWTGKTTPRWLRWTVITRYHLRLLFAGKTRYPVHLLLSISLVINVVFLAIIYIWANPLLFVFLRIPQEHFLKIDAVFFFYPFMPLGFVIGLLTLVVGSNLIADDRRDNALPLYLSKPLAPTEYLFGKLAVPAVFILGMTALPINLLFLIEVLIHGGWAFLKANWWLPLSITAYSALIAALCSVVILMASSLVKKGALAGVLVIGMFVGHNILAGIVEEMSGHNRFFQVLSLQFDLLRVGYWLFGTSDSPPVRHFRFSGPEAALVILGVIVVCYAILRSRIRAVEVVK